MPRTAAAKPSPAEQPLEGMPAEPAPEPTAGHLVQAWCRGWSEAHDGAQPDPSVVKRVAGICRSIARDRTDRESWVIAWRAAAIAGRQGRYDVVSVLAAAPANAGRGNHFLQLAQNNAAASTSGMLAAALEPRALGS